MERGKHENERKLALEMENWSLLNQIKIYNPFGK